MKEVMDYIHKIYRLKHLSRYNTTSHIKSESVIEHTGFVSLITLELHKYYDFDLEKALKMALLHDVPEIYIEDISHGTKRLFPELKEVIKKCEYKISKKEFGDNVVALLKEFDDCETNEAIIVTYADILSCVQYSKSELELGNKGYMQTVYDESIIREQEFFIKLDDIRRK